MVSRLSSIYASCLLFAAAAIAYVPTAHADAAGCRNPDWAPAPMPGFKIDACTDKGWATFNVELPQGGKTIGGHRTAVSYTHADGAPNASAQAVKQYQIAAAQNAGAKLASDPGASFNAVLLNKTAEGDAWYIYDHGDGSDDATESYTLTTVVVEPLPQEVVAQPVQAALDVSGKHCGNPRWLAKQFAYFKVDQCEAKSWDTLELDVAGGSTTLKGKRTKVTYTLTNEKQDPVAWYVQKNYVAALEKIGAKLMAGTSVQAVLKQATPYGEYWYIYDHGSGGDDSTESYTLTTFEIASIQQEVVARVPPDSLIDAQGKGCANPPWLVKQFPYFKLDGCTRRDIDSLELDLKDGKKTLVGHVIDVNYTLTDPKKDPTADYVRKNYVAAVEKIGGRLMSDPNDVFHAVLTQKTAHGDYWYLYTHTGGSNSSTTSYSLTTLQVGGPTPKSCKLEVYGVRFDFNKAALKPESAPVLNQLLQLFKTDPAYRAEIGGHTDNVGGAAYNLKLSGERANAVKAWLIAHGVAGARVATRGYGDTVPLVPNTTDANRAKNRRVELKKQNCAP